MKHFTWFLAVAALLLGCSGLAAAQCAGNSNPGGFDLLQTVTGTQDNLTSLGLGTVAFSGVQLGGQAGTADTIVCRITPLPNPIPPGGATLNIQIVAMLLQGQAFYNGQQVNVFAVINQTQNAQGTYAIPLSQLPVPDQSQLEASTGTMTVFSNGTFNTNSLNVQADIIVVPAGGLVTSTPIFTAPMPADTISSSGSTWTTTPPAGYPDSTTFPSGGFYVNQPGGGGGLGAALVTSRLVKGSLYGLGLVLLGIAVLKIRTSLSVGGRLSMRPVYLLAMAAMAWFLAWRSSKIIIPNIVHAKAIAVCLPHTVSVWVNEGGSFAIHKIVTAVCLTASVASL